MTFFAELYISSTFLCFKFCSAFWSKNMSHTFSFCVL